MPTELYSRLKRRVLSILQPYQEPLDIRSLRGSPLMQYSSSSRCAGNPDCGVCLFPLSRGARPSNIDADLQVQFYVDVFGPKELEASSNRGCRFCRNILKFALSRGAVDIWIEQGGKNRALEVFKSDETSSRFLFIVPLTFPYEDLTKAPRGFRNRICRGLGTIKMKSTSDDHVLDQAKLWWETCIRNHKCQQVLCSYKPTRLLRLEHKSNDTFIWLVTVTQPVQYVTLSHRWSKETEEISLSSSNLRQRMEKGILATELPRLMQDTIYVLARFRIKYLWIDSLCIIQDDDADWKREAGSMASIYKNAAFTISATKSQGSYDSLFSDPTKTAAGALLGTLPGGYTARLEEEPDHPFYYYSKKEGNYREEFLNNENNEGLLSRGWVYQEVLLSPRTLFFLDHEIMWRCQEHAVCQCARYDADDMNEHDKNVTAENGITGTYYVSRRIQRQISSRTWTNILNDYEKLDFTYPEDKVAALAGIAKKFGKEKQWTYLCGLWQEDISNNIAWVRCGATPKPRPDGSKNMPTWSWASTSSTIEHKTCGTSVEFKSYHAVYNDKEENPYLGDVKDAVLTVEGDILPAKLVRDSECETNQLSDVSGDLHREHARYGVSIMSEFFSSLTEDCILDESILEKPDVLLLGCPHVKNPVEYEHPCVLVLHRADTNSQSYKRLGVVMWSPVWKEWNWSRRQISLV